MQGAGQTAIELDSDGSINYGETEAGEAAISAVLPEMMSTVRHVSFRGHSVFRKQAN
jgi:hypothetical protein